MEKILIFTRYNGNSLLCKPMVGSYVIVPKLVDCLKLKEFADNNFKMEGSLSIRNKKKNNKKKKKEKH